MITSIMQPYLFPYVGYFQLIEASDIFVIHDDVQYIKRGWINRNRIAVAGEVSWITLPVARGAHELAINQRRYQLDRANVRRFLRRIGAAYRGAPNFESIFPMIEQIMSFEDNDVALFNTHSIKRISDRLGLAAEFRFSSKLDKDHAARGQDRVTDICRRLGASRYINPIGGLGLYDAQEFARYGIELCFLECTVQHDWQFRAGVIPSLSIIDLLMLNSDEDVARLLRDYRLLRPDPALPKVCGRRTERGRAGADGRGGRAR